MQKRKPVEERAVPASSHAASQREHVVHRATKSNFEGCWIVWAKGVKWFS
jgi:hypothetical protein